MNNSKHLKWILSAASIVLLAALFTACGDTTKSEAAKDPNMMRVGVMAGPEQKFMLAVKKMAADVYDLKVQLITYPSFTELNKALSEGEIDANVFQHHLYLLYSQQKYGYRFSELGQTYIYPMGVYSKKIKSILHLPKGAVIAIPDEPTNEARALFLLEKAGLIRMKSDENMNAGIGDIAANPSNFQILRLPSKEIGEMILTVDIAVLNIGYAVSASLIPSKDALVIENGMSAYASVVAVREGEESDPRMRVLIEVLQSPAMEKTAQRIFHGQAIPAWK